MKQLRSSPSVPRASAGATRPQRGGGPLILVALTGLLLVALTGLALDLAWVRSTEQELQNAADSASLAAARLVLGDSEATQFQATRQEAVQSALANVAGGVAIAVDPNPTNSPGGDVVVGRWDAASLMFTPDTQSPDAVQVRARRADGSGAGPLGLFFGRFFGVPTSNLARTAVSRADRAGEPLVLLFSDGSGALELQGSAELSALGGTVHLNSDEDCALSMSGNPTLAAARIDVGGTACVSRGSVSGALSEGVAPLPDPLAHVPPPPFSAPALARITGGGSYQPGYYDGIQMTGGTAKLAPGVYVIGGPGVQLGGNSRLEGDGVMIYLPKPARLDLGGNARVRLTGPTSGTYHGLTVFQDRTAALKNSIDGSASMDVEGSCYFYCSSLEANGACLPDTRIGQLLAWSLDLCGSPKIEVTGLGLRPPSAAAKPILTQ